VRFHFQEASMRQRPVTIGCVEIERCVAAPLAALSLLLVAQVAVFSTGIGEAIRFVIVNFGFDG
jgi:hypothetical protein